MDQLNDKLKQLELMLNKYGKLGVAFSGGVDSTFLLAFASSRIGTSNVTAITVDASNFAQDEIEYTKSFCHEMSINHLVIQVAFESINGFKENSKERCYFCKKSIFSIVKEYANEKGIMIIADGTNLDDDLDYRPGKKALGELGIVSPLKAVGLTKSEIRFALKEMGISIWDKPAFACLASRIPYGEEITEEKLISIYQVEKTIKSLGFSQVRVRHHGQIARIEILPEDIVAFSAPLIRQEVHKSAIEAGFSFSALDLEGYKMGNLNNK